MKKPALIVFIIVVAIAFASYKYAGFRPFGPKAADDAQSNIDQGGYVESTQAGLHPLMISEVRKGSYPGSELKIEETLAPGGNYERYIASYESEGNTIYGLLTVPTEDKPKTGFPVIIFNHGYIPPAEYRTTERYVAYLDTFARSGYIVFKPDYRGHGSSEGEPTGAYGSTAYVTDVLNAVSTIKRHEDVDPQRMGMWGHSMGGYITLRVMVVSKDIKAGVIWAGVVASYEDLLNNWRRRVTPVRPTGAGSWRQMLAEQYGEPSSNPQFWNSISANSYLSDLSGPVELHHGTADSSVPVAFSVKLDQQIKAAGKESTSYTYEGDDHNIAANFNTAAQRSLAFFDKHLK